MSVPDHPVDPTFVRERSLERLADLTTFLAVAAAALSVLALVIGIVLMVSSFAEGIGLLTLPLRGLFTALVLYASSQVFQYMAAMLHMKRLDLEARGIVMTPDEGRCPVCGARVLPNDKGCRRCNYVFERTLAEISAPVRPQPGTSVT